MAEFTTPEKLGADLSRILTVLAMKGEEKTTKIMKVATTNLFTSIITGTPLWFDGENEGTARGSWFITSGSPSTTRTKKQPTKGRSYVRSKLRNFKLGQKWFMANSTPYINVLEFGGYPKKVMVGSWSTIKKKNEKRSSNGFSKQAPKGMVRVNLLQWKRIIGQAIRTSPK